ncbi:MAG: Hsp20/alpha crystallin family protein [Planctomycetia bacterium]|nr:Hsp20/alpha crystallin family protein [Planctomycetia bacterium]
MTEATLQKEAHGDVETTRTGQVYRPNVDILERPDELLLAADMPGTRGEAIDIHFEDGELTIRGPVAARQPADTNYLLSEYGVGDFYRTFRVSEQIDASRIAAEYADGVLTLHLPKVEAAKPRKITVHSK